MAQTPYERQAAFTSYEVANPTAPKRGTDLDAEFDGVKLTSDETQANLSRIQRDDLKLRNLSVHPDALAIAVRALILLQNATLRGGWAPGTSYIVGDVVSAPNGKTVICYTAYESTAVYANDETGHWLTVAEAGISEPRIWQFTGDGVTTEFPIPGADTDVETYYQVTVGGSVLNPDGDYTANISPDTDGSTMILTEAPGNGVNGWVLLNGYPQPLPINFVDNLINNQAFLDLLKKLITNTLYETTNVLNLGPVRSLIPMVDAPTGLFTANGTHESYLIRAVSASKTVITIRKNTGGDPLDFARNPLAASFFSVARRTTAPVTIVGEAGVTLLIPPGFAAEPRGLNSIITLTQEPGGDQWLVSGDLAVA